MLDLNGDASEGECPFWWKYLVTGALRRDGFVVSNTVGGLGTKDGVKVNALWDRAKCLFRVLQFDSESASTLGDKDFIEIFCGRFNGGDTVVSEFWDKSALERPIDAFTSSPCLRAVGEDRLNCQSFEGNFKVGELVVSLEAMDASVSGGREMAGTVEIKCIGDAVFVAEVI